MDKTYVLIKLKKFYKNLEFYYLVNLDKNSQNLEGLYTSKNLVIMIMGIKYFKIKYIYDAL